MVESVDIELPYSLVIGRALLSTLLHVEDTVFHWRTAGDESPKLVCAMGMECLPLSCFFSIGWEPLE